MLEQEIVPIELGLLPEVIMPNGRTFIEHVRPGIVKRTSERYNTSYAADIWSGSEAQMW
jgi:hypothetical protein